ncbi:ion transporter [Oceanospirillum linum]|uniref:Ion transporter n=1 Tax=Oceanospirillum linum TaxID=966 RepID=A0A1T1HB19_OCELI|nr:ion transporter [Oceanospirillum linum]OOV87054.1 ion transporter [Oceanospirillum linum]SEF73000.1 voltage-gated potassium channel [Oleiphilus messinensis]SMP16120.1 voltage-gated potassium channel [Oceanospirillum linum]
MNTDNNKAHNTDADNSAVPETLKQKIYHIIFEASTPMAKGFDLSLIVLILLSVALVMLDSVQAIHEQWHRELYIIEWGFTIIFTIEYLLRLYSIGKPLKYATSFFGLVDLLCIIPTYLSLFIVGAEVFLVVRLLRVLRVFRILRLLHYVGEATALAKAMQASRRKITVFILTVLTMVTVFGSLMYLVEGPEGGYTSIPRSIYWAIVTLTTVGYGDITPQTNFGQFLSSIVMIMGYAVIAVPTGIVTVELSNTMRRHMHLVCHGCGEEGHDADADYCKLCGTELSRRDGRSRHLKPMPLPDRQNSQPDEESGENNPDAASKDEPPTTQKPV